MRPTWLIEAGVYGAEADPLIAEIRRQGMAVEVVPHQTLVKGPLPVVGGRALAPGDRVIGYGTFPFARQIQLHHRWLPGAWCDPANLDCATYFAHFGRFLLNQHYALLPGVEAIRQQDWLFEVFGRDDEVFARPAGCHKLFTGRRITRDAFASALSPTRYDPGTLVLVAEPRPVEREWRLVVAGNEVIAASQYATAGERDLAPGCPGEVGRFVETMLAEVRWRPDPIFMVDVCASEGRLWLVELNGFSCSWLYRCDLSAVVTRASELAGAVWTQAKPHGEA
ncbi:MAG: ATP-grasp domain-containing protein [Gemmataceae bacterium]|nr:ATP-grasp domain-containing protein [Gemmataceae bacterium]